jgi:histidinol-phosphate phosphatase family protein
MSVWKKCPPSWLTHHGAALFLDRDGVVITDRDYLSDPAEVEIISGADTAMKAARDAGFAVVGVSNQSGLGRGLFTPQDFSSVMTRIDALLAGEGTGFDGFFYCPHAPGDSCSCRKPGPGLLEEAALYCSWDSQRSWVVGDKTSDVALGRDHGMGAVLVRTGYGLEYEEEVRFRWKGDPRVMVADDLLSAWRAIQEMADRGDGP